MKRKTYLIQMIMAMVIFGSVGIIRRLIDMPSSSVALLRSIIGTLFLLIILLRSKQPFHWDAVRKNLILLILSSAFMAFNWIFLFEAYCYTSVTTATLCYYMAPSFMVIGSHFVLKEAITWKKVVCVAVALVGMVLVSGVIRSQLPTAGEIKGILYGLAAALLYACVILTNKKITLESSLERTILQLGIAAIVLLPYSLLTVKPVDIHLAAGTLALILVIGIVHTGVPYYWYFGSVPHLSAQSLALFSYVDPIVAIVLSALLLREPFGISELIGSVLILGAAYCSEKGN